MDHCVVCDASARAICGHCQQVAYCGQQHANQHWDVHSVDERYQIAKDNEELSRWRGVRVLERMGGITFYLFDTIHMNPEQLTTLREALEFSVSATDMCVKLYDSYFTHVMSKEENLYCVIGAVIHVNPKKKKVIDLTSNSKFSSFGFLSFALVTEKKKKDTFNVALLCSKEKLYYKETKKNKVRGFDEDDPIVIDMIDVPYNPKLGGRVMYHVGENVSGRHIRLHAANNTLVLFYRKLGYGLERAVNPPPPIEIAVSDDRIFDAYYIKKEKRRRKNKPGPALEETVTEWLQEFSEMMQQKYSVPSYDEDGNVNGEEYIMIRLPDAREKTLAYLNTFGDVTAPPEFWKTYMFRANEK